MKARALMVQGTASGVGKSLVTAGLCRAFARRGLDVAPFKAWNLSLNAALTREGLEVGRASAVQASAARVELAVEMNPVLVKPESEGRVRTILLGRPASRGVSRAELYEAIGTALARLRERHELIVIEGAGSPVELNLPEDLANMEVARRAGAPVVLVADLERGGAFAAVLGTLELLAPTDRERVLGFVLNRMRGDPRVLAPGIAELERRSRVPSLGVVQHLEGLGLPEEDALALEGRADRRAGPDELEIAVVRAPAASNLDELASLEQEPGVLLRFVTNARELHGADLVVLPGSKDVRADLAFLRARGFEPVLRERARRGEPVLGICGGCQMLGRAIRDPLGVEGAPGELRGFGLLPFVTRFAPQKLTRRVRARAGAASLVTAGLAEGASFEGYEIRHGRLEREAGLAPALLLGEEGEPDGAVQGSVVATQVHGLLEDGPARAGLLAELAARRGLAREASGASDARGGEERLERALERLADHLEEALDLAALERMLSAPR